MTVTTYGGLEILTNIFTAIAMLFNGGKNDIVHPLLIITASIGGIIAVSRAFSSSAPERLFFRYFFGLIVVSSLLMIPTTTIHIEDVLRAASREHRKSPIAKVDHVPFFFARFAEFNSSVGYQITKAIETVMHTPNDTNYQATGLIFGSDVAIDMDRIVITNADLKQNMRAFTKQCVFYDVSLGRYSLDELRKTTDLWGFLEEHSSAMRMISYVPPQDRDARGPPAMSYENCQDALKKMAPLFEKEKDYWAKQEISKQLPLTFQALTKVQQDSKELIGQQLMMQTLTEGLDGTQFAIARAQTQQRSTYYILGALASKSLIVMRVVLEALIYASFIFVLPMSLLPGGFKMLSSWLWMNIWIQLWPPFYAILNYIMQIVAQSQSGPVFHGLDMDQQGWSYFTSAGLQSLNQDIYAIAGYLSASIPFLSWAILKGGVSSFIHLAGSMMTPAHSSAGAAAAEQATGNYSLANSSFGQMSYGNTTAHQANLAPSLSAGFFTENRGTSSIVYGANENILRQANSELRTSLFGDQSTIESAQHAYQHANSLAAQHQRGYMDSLSSHGRSFVDYTDHLAHSANFSDSTSLREGYDYQESARHLESMAANWGEQYGLSRRESMEALGAIGGSAGGGLNLGIIRFGGDIEGKIAANRNASRDDILTSAHNFATSEDFQQHYQKVVGSTQSDTFSLSDDQGSRFTESFSHSLDEVAQSQQMHNISQSNFEQISSAMSATDQHSFQVRDALNQQFINWASDTHADRGGFSYVVDTLTQGSPTQKDELVRGFVDSLGSQNTNSAFPTAENLDSRYVQASLQDVNLNRLLEKRQDIAHRAQQDGLGPASVFGPGRELASRTEAHEQAFEAAGSQLKERLGTEGQRVQGRYDKRNNQWLTRGVWEGAERAQAILNKYSSSDRPLWLQGED